MEFNLPMEDVDFTRSYRAELNNAERNVNKLGKALENAEHEMETALRTTTDLYKSQLAQKQLEITELKRLIASKEKVIDQLREAISATKRGQEMKVHQLQLTVAAKDKELHAFLEEADSVRQERDNLSDLLASKVATARQAEQHLNDREQELLNLVHEANTRSQQLQEKLQQATADMEHSRDRVTTLDAHLSSTIDKLTSVAEELNQYKQKFHAEAELSLTIKQKEEENTWTFMQLQASKEAEILELKNKLRAERTLRKASEQLLKSEVKAREDMERLICIMKNVTIGKSTAEDEAASLLADMKQAVPMASAHRDQELEEVKCCLEQDNQRLKSELSAAKKFITSKLKQRL